MTRCGGLAMSRLARFEGAPEFEQSFIEKWNLSWALD